MLHLYGKALCSEGGNIGQILQFVSGHAREL
jgi:hypothetical protein